ncbi:hypothetical protein [Synechococcus elongatus]|uniref:Uncharacterized protein n=1 Tax=Synechococcus elongatus PCC 11801 TaxID=2219813 RepID=A0AAQ3RBK1_SYNEL|nr:hypothetical protein [Synechococcus elongatus]
MFANHWEIATFLAVIPGDRLQKAIAFTHREFFDSSQLLQSAGTIASSAVAER